MAISFNTIPVNLRIPGVYAEFDNTQALKGLPGQPYTALMLGQRLSTGTVAAEIPTAITNATQARDFFGNNSMLHHMAIAWFKNNTFTRLITIAQDDNGAGVAATHTITITGTATAAGTLNIYVGGIRVQAAIAVGDVQNTIATTINTAMGAAKVLAVTSGVATNVVTLTARHKGENGNDIDVRVNFVAGEVTPAGVTVAIASPVVSGTSNPALANTVVAMAETQYHIIANPYTDATSLTTLETELDDRWGPLRSIEGHAFSGADGSFSTMTTLGNSRNNEHITIMAANTSPTPPYELGAIVAAVAARFGNIDPARPLQTLQLVGFLQPNETVVFTSAERNLLLFDGISTFVNAAGGVTQVERLITTYETNASGADDSSYLDVNTMLTLSFLRFSFRNRFAIKFPRHKLASDGNKFGPGQAVVTPKVAKAEAIALFRLWEEQALVEGIDQFKDDLIVEINTGDPNRLDILLPPDLVNQLRVTAASIQFRL